jgi:hypothetical protein
MKVPVPGLVAFTLDGVQWFHERRNLLKVLQPLHIRRRDFGACWSAATFDGRGFCNRGREIDLSAGRPPVTLLSATPRLLQTDGARRGWF